MSDENNKQRMFYFDNLVIQCKSTVKLDKDALRNSLKIIHHNNKSSDHGYDIYVGSDFVDIDHIRPKMDKWLIDLKTELKTTENAITTATHMLEQSKRSQKRRSAVPGFLAKLKSPVIQRPPGHALVGVLRFALPKKAFDRIVSQIILDEREEHAEALQAGETWKARFISMRLWFLVTSALFADVFAGAMGKLLARIPRL